MSFSVGLQLWKKQILYKIFYELGPELSNSYLMAKCEGISKHNYAALLPISDQNLGQLFSVTWLDIEMI